MSSRSSKTDGLPATIRNNNELVIVGRVRRPHGIRGEVVVESMTDAEGRFAAGSRLQAVFPGSERGESVLDLEVEACRPHAGALLVTFPGVTDRDLAGDLRGAWLVVDRSQVPSPPDGGYWFFELIGCDCHDRELGLLGEVVSVVEDGGGYLLELRPIEGSDRARLLIPFRDQMLDSVDIVNRRIDTHLPAGLVEICTSKS